ncbi:MAG TPA: MarR family winged helix-turn-helix transcriptional regulator [Bradyrhizobium sp.]|nr:MarR family winged helix-turn-helix transcriptional regulator [Bradyrhizobium sp.]
MTRSPQKKNWLQINTYVPSLIAVVANKLTAEASQKLRANFGIGIVEWRVLSYLAANQPATGAAVSQSIEIDKAGVSRAASGLHKKGIVAFRRAGPNLGYILTAKGQRLHERVFELSVVRQRALLSGMSKSDVARLIRYLHILRNNVPAMEQADIPRRKSSPKPKG